MLVGTNSLGSSGLSLDLDLSLFSFLPLMGVVFELHAMAVTVFVIILKKYNFTFFLNKYYDIFYKTLQCISYSTYITIYNSVKKKKLQHAIADKLQSLPKLSRSHDDSVLL